MCIARIVDKDDQRRKIKRVDRHIICCQCLLAQCDSALVPGRFNHTAVRTHTTNLGIPISSGMAFNLVPTLAQLPVVQPVALLDMGMNGNTKQLPLTAMPISTLPHLI